MTSSLEVYWYHVFFSQERKAALLHLVKVSVEMNAHYGDLNGEDFQEGRISPLTTIGTLNLICTKAVKFITFTLL